MTVESCEAGVPGGTSGVSDTRGGVEDEDEGSSPAGIVVEGVSGVSGVPEGIEELIFSLVRLWFDQRPCIERFKTFEPCLLFCE